MDVFSTTITVCDWHITPPKQSLVTTQQKRLQHMVSRLMPRPQNCICMSEGLKVHPPYDFYLHEKLTC